MPGVLDDMWEVIPNERGSSEATRLQLDWS